ncbi:uncharacterized protein F4812DRAFT_432992 [Daldinia caldariorum]|uniref:uncharacterized protein n=1 Tax=Daldinia caldariorum TaxID=326644 RepID=UPI0020076A4E|nr:uncharacterized protein F4812DRAFT_432992 [Daldinia caldariorum]KAI1466833.1 hypothetical protein F4812DRAFT_432992 [Daldinia caldariorum]
MEKKLCEQTREVLNHRIRPRDEVTAVRRRLAHDLAQSLGAEELSSPLSLVDSETTVKPHEALQGIYREYVEAARRNIEIRSSFTALQEEHDAATASLPSPPEEDQQAQLLQLQIEVNALEQEHERLSIVDKYLEELNKQPAAAPDFLDPEVMFKGCTPLPELPKELMEGFTQDQDAPSREIQALLARLQSAVLRNKLLAQQEKQNFEKLKAKNPIDPGRLPPEVQLEALNAVKDSLITWIETMLSKAGGEEDEASPESPRKPRQGDETFDRDAHMAEIQREYQKHVDLRKEIVASMAQLEQLNRRKPEKLEHRQQLQFDGLIPNTISTKNTASEAFLLTPYLEKLQAISREKKGFIQEKSHINASLAKQQQEFNQILEHLVQESHLLPKYPAKRSEKPRQSFGSVTKGAGKVNMTDQIEPWISAAHSAQIATLEAVFEKVEEGQVAAEDAMQALDEVRKLLNKEKVDQEEAHEEGSGAEHDMWIGEDENSGTRVRKHREKKVEKPKGQSIYARLDGNLGLINE